MIDRLTSLFPLWAVLVSGAAWLAPDPFIALKPAIVYLLGLVMFGMGMTLTAQHFVEAFKRPRVLLVGTAMQYAFMPLIAYMLAILFGLPEMLLVGMVLVGASPGGTASNVICFLAKGDVALSITLTTLSTALAVVATPLLTLLYAGHQVEVPAGKMLLDIVKIIIFPVGLGLIANRLLGNRLTVAKALFPSLSVAAICVLIGIVVALNHTRLGALAGPLAIAVMLHNLLGLVAAYAVAAWLGWDGSIRRTLAIEVAMQNSGLAVFLALKYFAPAAALPGALFSIWHNLSGSAFAALVRRHPVAGPLGSSRGPSAEKPLDG